MWLDRLNIRNVRNLAEVSLKLSPKFNIISGANGSGKTSLLESIYLLSCGKSFRTHRFSNIATQNENWMGVYAKLSGNNVRSIPIGLEYRDRKNIIKVNGERLKKASELAAFLPVVVIHQESQRVFTQSPKYRRAFLDWGVFHVEQCFLSTWKHFNRSLKQRNALLSRRGQLSSIDHWNIELSENANLIDAHRRHYLDKFILLFNHFVNKLLVIDGEISVDYRRGWSEKEDYLNLLQTSLEKDRVMGYTQRGPHRADISFKINGVPLHEYVSRGQQKLLVCALYIAQAALYSQIAGRGSIFLIDDLTAELDAKHVETLLSVLDELDTQVFVTTPDLTLLDRADLLESRTFHVERGVISEVL
ncbi:MAG: DNA replication/repair protein RecF [Thiotrichaceae bacterium]|nr:DNA replication/repair protein RecF [Thiotrichaceae bacterium]